METVPDNPIGCNGLRTFFRRLSKNHDQNPVINTVVDHLRRVENKGCLSQGMKIALPLLEEIQNPSHFRDQKNGINNDSNRTTLEELGRAITLLRNGISYNDSACCIARKICDEVDRSTKNNIINNHGYSMKQQRANYLLERLPAPSSESGALKNVFILSSGLALCSEFTLPERLLDDDYQSMTADDLKFVEEIKNSGHNRWLSHHLLGAFDNNHLSRHKTLPE